MEDIKNPVTEAHEKGDVTSHYEFAFHILPTVAVEEVPGVFGDIKAHIDTAGGHITHEEAPQSFDLAYTVVKHTEGKNYKFNHSYFGWVRFTLDASQLAHLKEELEHDARILRSIMIKLSKAEIEQPFKMFEVKLKRKTEAALPDAEEAVKEVSEADIEKAVEDITTEGV
jgi:ribosomal protein S6